MLTSIRRREFLASSYVLGRLGSSLAEAGVGQPNLLFNVRDYGTAGNGKRKDTRALQAAIDACAGAGGGTVFVPPGRYLTGAIRLQSRVNLHLDSGAVILASQDPADYPVYPSPWQDGTRVISSLIYGENLTESSVTGRGTIDGQGHVWWVRAYETIFEYAKEYHAHLPSLTEAERREEIEKLRFGRPHLIRWVNCKNVLLEGVTIINSPCEAVWPVFCEYLTITGVTILNPSPSPDTDGFDPESCRNVHISDCHIECDDDCIAIKSGTDAVGRKMGRPSENIAITNLTTVRGLSGVALGSEMSGDIRNISISNCTFLGTARGIWIKTRRGRGGVVGGLVVSNIAMQDVRHAFINTMFYENHPENHRHGESVLDELRVVDEGTPRLQHFYVNNVTALGSKSAGQITGLREMPITDFVLSNVRISAAEGFFCQNARQIGFHNVQIDSVEGPALRVRDVQGLELDGFHSAQPHPETPIVDLEDVTDVFARGCSAASGTATFLRVARAKSSNLVLRANNLARATKAVAFTEGAERGILSQE
jgi:polygalacturonase